MTPEYKALFVKRATHTLIATEAKSQEMTIDEFLNLLEQLWKQSQKKK